MPVIEANRRVVASLVPTRGRFGRGTTPPRLRRLAPLCRAVILALAVSTAFAARARAETTAPAAATERVALPALGAVIDQTSTSGISSGAYMAGQFQIAHSSEVIGAAIIAGGPYGCAESLLADWMWGPSAAFFNMSKAVNGCMLAGMQMWGVPDVQRLAARARKLAEEGRIDPLSGLAHDRLYLFSGRNDYTVVPAIVAKAAEFYAAVGVPASNMLVVTDVPAGHAFITVSEGNSCALTEAPFVVHCDYDQAGALLGHIYGELKPAAAQAGGDFIAFDQRAFASPDAPDHGLSDTGVVYVPRACRETAGCRVHIAFHGCGQNRAFVGDAFVRESGFARWADTNRLVVLFPQVMASVVNPQGCWDWWGYTGRDFLTRSAPQIAMVHRMLARLASPR